MTNRFQDSFRIFFLMALMLLLCGLRVGSAQASSRQEARIEDLSANVYVSVEFEVRAAEKQLVIPVCRQSEGSGQSLCVAHLQRFIGGRWVNAAPRRDMAGVLGVYGKELWKPLVISPGDHSSFKFGYSKDFFGIPRGERLRILLTAWDSADSMARNDDPGATITSPVFKCP
jgi:hypothetical protein